MGGRGGRSPGPDACSPHWVPTGWACRLVPGSPWVTQAGYASLCRMPFCKLLFESFLFCDYGEIQRKTLCYWELKEGEGETGRAVLGTLWDEGDADTCKYIAGTGRGWGAGRDADRPWQSDAVGAGRVMWS